MRRRVLAAVGLVAAVAIGGAGLVVSQRSDAASATPGADPGVQRLVPVVRTTLAAAQPVSGQVTSSEAWTVGLPLGSTSGEVATAADAVATARDQLAGARSSLRGAIQARALIAARDDAAVAAAPVGAARRDATRGRSLDRIEQDGTVQMARAAVAEAQRVLTTSTRELASKRTSETAGGSVVTALPAPGTTVARGGTLYEIDGRPVALMIGTTPAYRALREGDVGPDVAQLQTNLVALGLGGSPAIRGDGTFDHATALAVQRWQSSRHVASSGAILLGDIVVLPTAARVSATNVAVGGGAQPGSPILQLSSVDHVVKVEIDPGLARKVHVGDAIRFSTPDRSDIAGSIASVGAPAVSSEASPNGAPGRAQVEVVATADDPAALAELEGASLTADVITATAPDVLAVPVAALVVLGDGSFGIEIAAGGTTHFVRVTPGIFDRSMVEISADGVAPGDQVVVPGA